MTPPSFAEIHQSRVSTMGLTDGEHQTFFALGNCDQMNVIGHQTIGPDLDMVFLAPCTHQITIRFKIRITEKSLLPTVPPLGYVVGHPGCYSSC
jgi:hypothetical protein